MTFLSHPLGPFGFIRDFLDHYVDRCRINDVHVV